MRAIRVAAGASRRAKRQAARFTSSLLVTTNTKSALCTPAILSTAGLDPCPTKVCTSICSDIWRTRSGRLSTTTTRWPSWDSLSAV